METRKQKDETGVAVTETRGVDVARLERELSAMWRENVEESEGTAAGEAGVTRVCVANLIVFAPPVEGRDGIDALLEEVTAHTPCRAVVLLADADADAAALDAYVSTRCQPGPRGAKQICGEQVTIEAAGRAVENLATAVEPLLVPDIPTFLWWKDIPHYEDKLFARLVELSDRVVIDSASFDHPLPDLRRVARLVGEHPRLALSDLNWGRLTTWRNLLAGFWDVADYREHLDRLDTVEIEYTRPAAAPDQTAAQALLLAGWLASRLGWELAAAERYSPANVEAETFRLSAAGREFTLSLRAVEGAGEESSITVREVRFARVGGEAEFHTRMSRDQTKLETGARVGGAQSVGRVVSYEARTEGERLSREMALLARDRIYEEAVAAVVRIIESPRGS